MRDAAIGRSTLGLTVGRFLTGTLALVASTTILASSARAQAGLVAAYGFSETSGTTTADASGGNNTGTLGTGVTRTTSGRFGSGLVFNGTNGRVTVPNAASLTLTTAMTLEAWVNPTLVKNDWIDVIYKGNDNYYLMAMTTTSSRPAGGGIFGPSNMEAYGTSPLALNTWTHLATTYDGAAIRLYVNGALVSTVAHTGAIATSTNPLTIGGDPIYGQNFKGTIDEVRVYNRALSDAEVVTDMNTAIGPIGPDNSSPVLSVTSPTSAATYTTNAATVTLSGTAADNVGVTQVTWVNNRGGSGTATGTTSWSATSIALQTGANVLTVTARDAAGNVGTAVLTVTSDAVVPTVAITSPTSGATYIATATPMSLSGTAGDNVGVTQVTWANSRGGSGTATGTTNWSVGGIVLQSGSNVLTVTARDAVGNIATSTLTVTYTPPDVTLPTISITAPTSAGTYATNVTSLTIGGSAADNVGVTQVTWVNDRGGSGTATGTTAWSATSVVLQTGANVLTVTARDAAGNTGTAVLTVNSDPVVPTVAITTPTGGPTHTTSASPMALGGTAGDNVGVTQVTWANNRGGSGTASGTTNWSATGIALQTGANILTVTARDAVGNVATSTLTVTYTAPDVTLPTIGITSPTSTGTYATNAASLTVGGSAADNVGVTQVTWVNSRGGSGTATGTTSWSAAGITLALGTNVLTLTASDAAGNVGTAVLTVTSDPTVPTVAITTPTAGATYSTTSTPLSISGTAGDNVGVTQVTWANSRGGSGTATGTASWSVAGIALQAGDNVLTVTARDAVGNTAAGVLTVTYAAPDNTVPTISITSPTSGATYSTNVASLTVSGSAADNVGVTQVTWSNSAGGSGTATGTTSWAAAGIALAPGSNVITVTARDAANNPATATLTITQDAVVPTVTVTAPGAGASVSGAVSVTASSSDNVAVLGVQFLLDGANLGTEVTVGGPTYTATWTTNGIPNGPHTLSARARDAAGNTSLAPDVSVTVSNAVPTGLIAAYGFNEASGTTTADASGGSNTGTLGAGVTRTTTGKFGGALVFNGTTGRVNVPNTTALNPTTAVTLEAWVNPTVLKNDWLDVVYKGNDIYYLMAMTTNASRPAGGGTFGGGTIEAYGTAALALNAWTHLAMTYDGANIRTYVNGTQVSSVARTGAIATSTQPLTIGGDPIYGQNFQGTIDEVRVYSRALTAGEIVNDMNTAIGGGPPTDTQAPTIAFTTPTGTGAYTATASPLSIGGTAADNVGVTQVTWSSDRGGSGTASGTTSWSATGIVLQPGINVITVTALDASSNTGAATLSVTYNAPDVSAPTIAITGPTGAPTYATNTSSLTLVGTAADNVGVTQVTWANSAGGSGTATGTTSWSASGIALQAGSNVLTVTARDAANNISTATLAVTRDGVAPTVVLTAPGAGTTVTQTGTTITASASDNHLVAGVQMLLDGASLGAELVGSGPTFNYAWNPGPALNGPHTLSARVRDAAGNTSLAPDVAVTVANTAPSGLVASYGFEEPGGTSVVDASGNNNTGTMTSGVTRTVGRIGTALSFNGTTGKINVPNSASLALTTEMTLEAWVLPARVDANWRDIIYKGLDNYYLMGTSNTAHPAGGGTLGGAGTSTVFATSGTPLDTWTHVAVTYDGAALRMFMNGEQVSSLARTGAIATSNSQLEIGGDATWSQYYHGVIDEVRIYNRALSATEIQADMTVPVTDPAPTPTPATVGQWSAPFAWPLVGLHAALLKTGEVISWEFDGAGGPFLWNPTTGQFTSAPQGTNKFCAGQAALPDGRFLVIGGHQDTHVGLKELNIFDPVTRTWTAAPNMTYGRWYPTGTGLADGRMLIMSGETTCDGCNALIPEIYDPISNTVSRLTGASQDFAYYPHMYVMPDGRVLEAATAERPTVTKILNVGTQTWTTVDPVAVDGGSSVMYLPGKVMKSGTSHNPDLTPDPSFPTTYVLDMTQASPHWVTTQPMAYPRTYHTLSSLPDGTVLATGGGTTTDPINPAVAVYAAELWSPATQTWTTLSSGSVPRLYHSTAILLPDGRVVVGSGGRFNGYPSTDPADKLNAEFFSPPYLFKGARPTITSAPASAGWGSTINVQTPDAASIASVALIRLASVTHAFNTDQRYLPLSFTTNGGSLDIQMPANANLAPPGHYMLFILNGNGVPSVAPIIRIQ